ncbi:ribosome maturation factor RimP [Legionella oakridgensis]|uniref:Ribosome maturation factor RimP n=2 Tax=Legionella oakridgensis TaxID=29423 RepID=W0BCK4_9GAMM|nr:ribosome maturation factor RimP [Legionella oakridgensis]AHE68243.1 hypothetical protein Loa_02711 [Legionella oakridgensis ATCC 33761 = DSM 21215]ETO92326.1 hypothetical protein LOR_64c17660 [Legionella oakridgensis RV-2-2007]KTD39562.1 Ribosome maturation factor RimP [Legionella oakridgensis]STY21201.1 NusA-like protein [Legionella longbeachae]
MIQNEIERLINPVIDDMGYVLWGCEYLAQGKHALLRIYIDHEDGIGIDDCERVSRQISALLDVEDPISGNYRLEVSSPGIPRPLFYNWQYQQYLGKDIHIKLLKPINGKRKFSGTIVAVNENGLILNINNEHQEFLISNIVKANLIV